MRKPVIACIALMSLVVSSCGRQNTTTQTAPVVAPITPSSQDNSKHYTQTDFDTACFPYPNRMELLQYKAAGLQGQDAVDYEYLQWAKRYPGPTGFCTQKQENEEYQRTQQPAQLPGQWIENAPANDMSHYGDALPGGKH